jgi:hypothetical protein
VRVIDENGELQSSTQNFETTCSALLQLNDWLASYAVGCAYERATPTLVAVDMAPTVDVAAAYRVLEAGERAGMWGFEEGYYFDPRISTKSNGKS